MKKNILRSIKISIVTLVLASLFTVPVFAADCDLTPGGGALAGGSLILVPWYQYLDGDDSSGVCRPVLPGNTGPGGTPNITQSVALIGAAILELLMRISALIAAGFVIYGSIQYITSQGEPEGLSNAKNTIVNALIGLLVVLLSIALVQFIGRALQ